MKRLLATAAAIVALVGPAKASMEQSKANASLVIIVAAYRDKCGTPPDAISKTQLILRKNHDYTSDMEMEAMVDVATKSARWAPASGAAR